MARPKLSEQTDLHAAIRRTAWSQMAELGAAGISLRGIARELSITAPAIYNHFPSRDELVTELIVEAYTSLGDAQAAALPGIPLDAHAGRLRAVGVAYRSWAICYPQRYQLIFGTPIPGYRCPVERTMKAGAYSLSTLVGVLERARRAGHLRMEQPFTLSAEQAEAFQAWQLHGVEADLAAFGFALLAWTRVHGLVSLEIGGQLPPFGPDAQMLYDYELDRLVHELLLEQLPG